MKTLLLSGLALLALHPPARAEQRDDRGRREGPRVIVYQHAGFSGDSLVLFPGESIDNMSGKTFANGAKLNDSISSIRIEGDAEVFVYENSRYRGQALRLTESTRDLTGRLVGGSVSVDWNDRISSIKIEWVRGRDRGPDKNGPRDNAPGGAEKIIKLVFNDVLGREPTAGESRDFRARIQDQGWTERMLRDHLRREDNYREEAADLLVKRAYRDVLGREADPGGLRTYRRNMLEREWTESDVRDDLRKSAEFRNRSKS